MRLSADFNIQSAFITLVSYSHEKQYQIYQGKISNPLAGLEFDNKDK